MQRNIAIELARVIALPFTFVVSAGCAESPPAIPTSTSSSPPSVASSAPLASAAAPSTPGPSASSSSAEPAPLVDLHPFTISFQGKTIARLFADGRTESAGQNAPGSTLGPGPTLRADGTMVMTRGGVTARLDPSGDIHVIQPPGAEPRERLFGRISGDELKFAGSKEPWSVRVRGNLIEFGKDNSSVIDGDVTPAMRRAALVMAAAFTIDGAIAR